jgi:hypothetical protein
MIRSDASSGSSRPGPIYDNALRTLAADELVTVCQWLGIDADIGTVRLSEALPAYTQHADLLVATGPGHLAQVEFVRQPSADLPIRMLEYRARIMRLEPTCSLRQLVVVMAGGRVKEELRDGDRFSARFDVVYLRTTDPADLLGRPSLAPMAPLGRARTKSERAMISSEALQVIRRDAPPERATDLAGLALVMAAVYLDPDTIESARREAAMPISLEGTVAGRIIEQRAEARGLARGEAHGRAEGEAAGRVAGEIAASPA